MSINEMLMAAAGSSSADVNYIDSCFSTYLYTGTGATQTITNGIDLSGKGGLAWIKRRGSGTGSHQLFDTVRGVNKYIRTNGTDAQDANGAFTDLLTSFNSNGFTLGADASAQQVNSVGTGDTYCSWTFREQAKFFDIVTYTGNGTSGRTVSHNLGSVPGMIIVKSTSLSGEQWFVWHRSISTGNLTSNNLLRLNLTNAQLSIGNIIGTASSTNFEVGTDASVNGSGATYVAYLFAHNAGGFGAAGTDNVISCGSFTTDGSGNATVSLGYEPQYLMFKASSATGNWFVVDVMREWSLTNQNILRPNLSDAEFSASWGNPTATGFTFDKGNLAPSTTFIYMTIRRPMKVPTTGTSVFGAYKRPSSELVTNLTTTITPDWVYAKNTDDGAINWLSWNRLTGTEYLNFNRTNAGSTSAGLVIGFNSSNTSVTVTEDTDFNSISQGEGSVFHWFRRASGFFDQVCYTGTGSARTVAHNLTVAPELMIVKSRSEATGWFVYSKGVNNGVTPEQYYLTLNGRAAAATASEVWNDTSPTSSVFSLGTNSSVNGSGQTYVAYLFATVAGVSKVGSYTGNGSSQTINCGFTAGARFVMVKATSAAGDWVVLDTARGIVSGNDPFLQLNSTAAEVTGEDIVDPANSGFIVNSTTENINASGGTYIYLAIS